MLPFRVRQGYGVGAFALSIANTSVLFFLLKFLVDEAGLPPLHAGGVLLVGKTWDALSDPWMGRLTDRTRSAMGARRPWIVGGSIPFALLFGLLWTGLPLQGFAAVVGYTLLLVAYNTAYTVVVVPYGALTPSLAQDYDERTRLNGARMGWSMIGGLVAGIAFPVLLERTDSFAIAGGVLALLIAPPLWVTFATTAGRDHTPKPSEAGTFAVLKFAPFRRVSILFVLAWTSIAVLSAMVPFYVEHHLENEAILDLVFAAIQISALASIPAVVWLAARVQKHIAYAGSVLAWALVLILLAAAPSDIGMGAIVLAALAGPGVAAAHVLPWAMLPDVVEEDTRAHGSERAGAFYGTMTFLEQLATAVALWLLGVLLELSGYVSGAASQPDSAVLAIRLVIGPLPAAALLLAAFLAWTRPPSQRG